MNNLNKNPTVKTSDFGTITGLALCRLFQLISPSLPIGGYSYSQGIEWAVERGWVSNEQELHDWLKGLLETNMLYLDMPVFIRMLEAWRLGDEESIQTWNQYLLASRETSELRQEELNRARAFTQFLLSLIADAESVRQQLLQSQHACFSYACHRWNVNTEQACLGLLWSWLENQVLSAVKIIPLGQTAGQRTLFRLSELLPGIIERANNIPDDEIGSSCMALSIASSQHETQYTRLFRS